MLPQKSTILLAVMMMATLLSSGSLSLMPLDVYASHSYEAGVEGDNIPDNTHIDLSQLILPSAGVFPLYDSSPNFVSGHFLYKGPCEDGDEDNDGTPFEPIVSVIAGHIDESANLTHVDFVPLYYVGHASPIPGICVYHAHIPDPLEGGSPRVTDIDLVNFSPEPVAFNPGDAVDVNIQRTLGNIGDYYANDVLLPLQLAGGNNKVIDLNEEEHEEEIANNANVQQTLGNLIQFNSDDVKLPHESLGENNKVFNFNDQHDNDNDNDEEDNDEDEDNDDE
jgi:hypothetical protein